MRRSIQGVVLCASVTVGGAARGQEAVQWRVEDGGNGHWYQIQFDPTPVCWNHANARSRALGGHLVTLTSFAENAFVVNSVVRPADPGTGEWGPYIGATAQGLPWGTWRWVTDEPWSFSGFEEGEPNSNGSEVHVHYRHWQYGLYWNDSFSCGMTRSFVIEWSADCNGDGIVDYGQCRDGTLADLNSNGTPDCCEAGVDCDQASERVDRCAVFARATDTVRISGANTQLQGDYTIEWSGYLLNQPVMANPPATWNARIWSEQDSVTEDKMIGLNVDRTASAGVNSLCYSPLAGPEPVTALARRHVALVRLGDLATLFVDGVAVSSAPQGCAGLNGQGSNMALGAFVYVGQPQSNYWRAAPLALDWIRVSGIARYVDGFPVPREPLVADESTQLLINFIGENPWRDLANPGAVLSPGAGVAGGTSPEISVDCDGDGVPDQVQVGLPGADTNADGIPDACQAPTCTDADLFPSGTVNGADLGILLSQWGAAPTGTVSDLNRDGTVDGADLGLLLSFWGPCAP